MRDGWGRVERPDVQIWYHDTTGDLPVLVLLHGLAGYSLEWGATIGALREEWRVLGEQRGHGSSTPASRGRRGRRTWSPCSTTSPSRRCR